MTYHQSNTAPQNSIPITTVALTKKCLTEHPALINVNYYMNGLYLNKEEQGYKDLKRGSYFYNTNTQEFNELNYEKQSIKLEGQILEERKQDLNKFLTEEQQQANLSEYLLHAGGQHINDIQGRLLGNEESSIILTHNKKEYMPFKETRTWLWYVNERGNLEVTSVAFYFSLATMENQLDKIVRKNNEITEFHDEELEFEFKGGNIAETAAFKSKQSQSITEDTDKPKTILSENTLELDNGLLIQIPTLNFSQEEYNPIAWSMLTYEIKAENQDKFTGGYTRLAAGSIGVDVKIKQLKDELTYKKTKNSEITEPVFGKEISKSDSLYTIAKGELPFGGYRKQEQSQQQPLQSIELTAFGEKPNIADFKEYKPKFKKQEEGASIKPQEKTQPSKKLLWGQDGYTIAIAFLTVSGIALFTAATIFSILTAAGVADASLFATIFDVFGVEVPTLLGIDAAILTAITTTIIDTIIYFAAVNFGFGAAIFSVNAAKQKHADKAKASKEQPHKDIEEDKKHKPDIATSPPTSRPTRDMTGSQSGIGSDKNEYDASPKLKKTTLTKSKKK